MLPFLVTVIAIAAKAISTSDSAWEEIGTYDPWDSDANEDAIHLRIEVAEGENVTVEICGPSDTWYGIAFSDTNPVTMDESYAIIIYYNGSMNTKWIWVQEYGEGAALHDYPFPLVTQEWYSLNDVRLCSRFRRVAVNDNATDVYDGTFQFPTEFEEGVTETYIAIAQGQPNELDYNRSKSISSITQCTLSVNHGVIL